MGELGSAWWHFSSAGHEIHSFVNIFKKGKNLFTRSSNSLASWITDKSLTLVKAKIFFFLTRENLPELSEFYIVREDVVCCMSKGDGLGFLYWNGWGTSPSEHTSAFVSDLCVPAPFDVVNCGLRREGSGFCRTSAHLWQELEGRQMKQWIHFGELASLLAAVSCPVSSQQAPFRPAC